MFLKFAKDVLIVPQRIFFSIHPLVIEEMGAALEYIHGDPLVFMGFIKRFNDRRSVRLLKFKPN